MWKYAITIYQVIQGEGCVEVTTRLSKSYEYFAKIEPNLYISRARFLLCVRQALASETSIACCERFSRDIGLFVQKLSYERDKINWRTFFLLMFALDNPKWSFKEILMRALYLLLSDSSLCSSRIECTGRIKLSWFCDAIEPFIKVDMRKTFFSNVYSALIDVLSTANSDNWVGGLESTVHWKKISLLLDHKLLSEFCHDHKLWCKKGVNAYMSEAENR